MAIKTDALQQNAAPKGADTLLMADSAGGTAQLSLDRLAEFLTGQDNAVRTALSNKAALSAQQTVEKTGVSAETVHITAAELPGYIASLPRLLLKNLVVAISGGTVASTLNVTGFYGPGRVWIQREGDTPLVLTKGAVVMWNTLQIILSRLTFRGEHAPESGGSFVEVYASSSVSLEHCEVDGTGTGGWGVLASSGSAVYLNGCTVQKTHGALLCQGGCVMSANNCAGADNSVGATVYYGGLILLSGTTPNLMGGSANGKSGGLIASAAGTVL